MRITDLRTADKVPFNLDGRKMLVDTRVEIVHLTLQPNEVLAKHTNPFDVAIYVLEGEGMVETDEHTVSVSPDMCIEVPSGANRGITNASGGNLRVLVIKIFER